MAAAAEAARQTLAAVEGQAAEEQRRLCEAMEGAKVEAAEQIQQLKWHLAAQGEECARLTAALAEATKQLHFADSQLTNFQSTLQLEMAALLTASAAMADCTPVADPALTPGDPEALLPADADALDELVDVVTHFRGVRRRVAAEAARLHGQARQLEGRAEALEGQRREAEWTA
eukprot:EG_transcript_29040